MKRKKCFAKILHICNRLCSECTGYRSEGSIPIILLRTIPACMVVECIGAEAKSKDRMRNEETEVRRKEVASENLRNLRQLFIGGCFLLHSNLLQILLVRAGARENKGNCKKVEEKWKFGERHQ